MGYLTTITLYNDAYHDFERNPEEFGKTILKGIHLAQREGKEITVPFQAYCNYISINPPKHADDTQIYLHRGNRLNNLTAYTKDMKEFVRNNPKLAKEYVAMMQRMLTETKRYIKDEEEKNKE